MTPIEIQAILQYSSHFFPALVSHHANAMLQLSGYGYVAAILIMLFVVMLNTFGIKILAECNKYTSILKFLLPSVAIISLLHTTPTFGNLHLNLSHTQNWVQIFTALSAGGVVFAFTGFQNGLILSGEVKNPQRNIPIAILGAVLIGFILYFMLQLSFIAAIPQKYLTHGWQNLSFPGESGPLVGLTLLLGLGVVATLLMFDAAFSPFGTTLVYTAATSRILYGMAANGHLPKIFLKLNKYKIPHITLYANFFAGVIVFLPFPGWQKMVTFLSSTSILSYGIGPICLLALRTLHPNTRRPFKLAASTLCCHAAFYACNLMLYWCGFSNLWKLYIAIWIGILIHMFYQHKNFFRDRKKIYPMDLKILGRHQFDETPAHTESYVRGLNQIENTPRTSKHALLNDSKTGMRGINWFLGYMTSLLLISYCGSFDGIGWLKFPYDLLALLPFSLLMLYLSQRCLIRSTEAMDALIASQPINC
jgi:amino acid transporter